MRRSGMACLFGWFLNVLVNYYVISRTDPKTERLTILHASTHETELGDNDFCLSRSHYTDTDPTSRASHSVNRTRDLLTRSRTLYRLSFRAPVRYGLIVANSKAINGYDVCSLVGNYLSVCLALYYIHDFLHARA